MTAVKTPPAKVINISVSHFAGVKYIVRYEVRGGVKICYTMCHESSIPQTLKC